MAQQINLCTPILLKPKHYFSAQTMVQTVGVFVVLGGLLCGTWVWNLKQATDGYARVMARQTQEIDGLQSAIQRGRAAAGPVDAALLAQLRMTQSALQQREALLAALQQGVMAPGWGHSDRLQWVARSIPAPVWVSNIKMDVGQFAVSGFTLEPAALNDWVAKLSINPLMHGMKLATVKVQSTAAGPAAVSRPVWSFSLVSAVPTPAAPVPTQGGAR
jgi:Tfp pilus assembly protein PilN